LCELYSGIGVTSFSHDVLAVRPNDLAVLRATDLGWSDLGEPGRVLSVLERRGVQTGWGFERWSANKQLLTGRERNRENIAVERTPDVLNDGDGRSMCFSGVHGRSEGPRGWRRHMVTRPAMVTRKTPRSEPAALSTAAREVCPTFPAVANLHPRGHSRDHLNSVEIGLHRAFAAFGRREHTLPREKDIALFTGNDAVSMPREMASGDAC